MNITTKLLEVIAAFPEGVPQPYLAKALGISKSYLSLILKDLEKKGLVYRVKIGNVYVVKPANVSFRKAEGRVLRLGIVWSSEYLFLGSFAKMLKEREGVELKVQVYPSALQTVLALIRGEVDAVLSPIATLIYGYLISKSLVIVGGGAGGGGYLYEIPQSRSNIIASSEISTMDLCRTLALKKGFIEVPAEDTKYFSSAQEAVAMARRGLARYMVVWHPINVDIERVGGRKVMECSAIEELTQCCTLAISRFLGLEVVERVGKIYRESIEVFNKDRSKFLEWYSNIVGIDVSILKKAINEYTYSVDLPPKLFSKIVDALGFEVPAKNYLLRALEF